jgi:hypothetical protein
MKRRSLCWMAGTGILMVAASVGAGDHSSPRGSFAGVINDYTPAEDMAVTPFKNLGGPWEIRGVWSLTVKGHSGRADFSAALTMERTDVGVTDNGGDLNMPSTRVAHTHHITVTNGTVTSITGGFEVSGAATITGNGNPAPFGEPSTLQIDVTGGSDVAYSNVALTFGGKAVGHFGSQAVHGVVVSFSPDGDHEKH